MQRTSPGIDDLVRLAADACAVNVGDDRDNRGTQAVSDLPGSKYREQNSSLRPWRVLLGALTAADTIAFDTAAHYLIGLLLVADAVSGLGRWANSFLAMPSNHT